MKVSDNLQGWQGLWASCQMVKPIFLRSNSATVCSGLQAKLQICPGEPALCMLSVFVCSLMAELQKLSTVLQAHTRCVLKDERSSSQQQSWRLPREPGADGSCVLTSMIPSPHCTSMLVRLKLCLCMCSHVQSFKELLSALDDGHAAKLMQQVYSRMRWLATSAAVGPDMVGLGPPLICFHV